MLATVLGFSGVFPVTNKDTGVTQNKINVSISLRDPEYVEGVRAVECYLTVTKDFPYDWLVVDQKVDLIYSKWGRVTALEPVD